MKISKQQLIELKASQYILDRFVDQTNGTDDLVSVESLFGGKNTISDLMWLAGKTVDKRKIIEFACSVALINIEKIKPYTEKYDEMVRFLNNPEFKYAANDAAADAYAAADAAYAAAADAYAAYAAADALMQYFC